MFSYPARFGRHRLAGAGYAVVDLETTGFDAWGADRIVEIAIVRIDAAGRELGVYETLVNPGRSTGAVGVHQISTDMAARAPTFEEIASSVLAWLEAVVVVAHNAPFEDAFLSAEFARAGIAAPAIPALDTLPLAQSFVPTPNHRLATVCAWGGVTIDGPHTALGDARATAQVLPRLLATRRSVPRWRHGFSRLVGVMERLPGRAVVAPVAGIATCRGRVNVSRRWTPCYGVADQSPAARAGDEPTPQESRGEVGD
ncbi:MAG: 3'-5' exonuclease [Actinobacteria bacterium]|nr:3'-5' exonuclease [Actinomycetota bacterium]